MAMAEKQKSVPFGCFFCFVVFFRRGKSQRFGGKRWFSYFFLESQNLNMETVCKSGSVFFALPFKHHDMKVAWLDSGWMYCLYTFSQSLLSGYRGFGQATRWWGIPKKHRQAKRLEQHHRQGLDTFICTHHGHFHADEAQPNMTQCMFCIAFCGVFVSFW